MVLLSPFGPIYCLLIQQSFNAVSWVTSVTSSQTEWATRMNKGRVHSGCASSMLEPLSFSSIPFFSLHVVVQKSTARNLLQRVDSITFIQFIIKPCLPNSEKVRGEKWAFVLPKIEDQWFFSIILSPSLFCSLQRYKIFNKNSVHCTHHI